MFDNISIVIPCKNEGNSIGEILGQLIELYDGAEIIVVDDGSDDGTTDVLRNYPGIILCEHLYNIGNGAAVKTGVTQATREIVVLMDADGQHNPTDVARLLEKINEGYDMVVGARDFQSQASHTRAFGNGIYNRLATLITGHKIADLTSGFRAVRREYFMEFISLLPNGFSYPTTITMAFFRRGLSVTYLPISANGRIGDSHLSVVKDGIRFLLIIFKVGALYSPLKIFAPLSMLFFSSGLLYYLYTYISASRFTNMGLLLFVTSVVIFIFGLISEQITMLTYMKNDHPRRK